MPLLSLSRVDFDFGREALLRDVTLDFEPGEKAALVGINGSGKSTLLQILAERSCPTAASGTCSAGRASWYCRRRPPPMVTAR